MERRGHIDPKVGRGEFEGSYKGDLDAGRELLKTGKLPPLAPRPKGMPSASREPMFDQYTGERLQPGQSGTPSHPANTPGHPDVPGGQHRYPGGGYGGDAYLHYTHLANLEADKQRRHELEMARIYGGRAGGVSGGVGGHESAERSSTEEKKSAGPLFDASNPEHMKMLKEVLAGRPEAASAGEHKGAAAAFGARTKEIAAKIEAEKSGGNPEKVRRWMNPLRRWLAAVGLGLPGGAAAALSAKGAVGLAGLVPALKGMAGFTVAGLSLPAWPFIAAGLVGGVGGGILWHKFVQRKMRPLKSWEEGMEQGWRARKLYKGMEADDSMAAIERKYAAIRRRPAFFRMQAIPRILGGILGGATAVDLANVGIRGGEWPLGTGTRTGQLVDLIKAGWSKGYETVSDPAALWESIRTKIIDALGGTPPDTAPIEALRDAFRGHAVGELDRWIGDSDSAHSQFLALEGNEELNQRFADLRSRLQALNPVSADFTTEFDKLQRELQELLRDANADFAEHTAETLTETRDVAVVDALRDEQGRRMDRWTERYSGFLSGYPEWQTELAELRQELADLKAEDFDTPAEYKAELERLQAEIETARSEVVNGAREAGIYAAEMGELTNRVSELQTSMDEWGKDYEDAMKKHGLFEAFQRLYGEVDYADAGDFRSPAEYAEYIRGLEERFGDLQESVAALQAEDVEHERGPDRPEGAEPLATELERLKDTFHYEGSHPRGVWGAIEDMIKARLEARGVTDARLLNVLTDIFEDYLQDGSMPGTRSSSYFDSAILEQVAGREGATERNIFSRGLARFEYLIGNSDVLAEAMERIEMPVNRLSVSQRAVAEGIVQELYSEARRLMAMGRAG